MNDVLDRLAALRPDTHVPADPSADVSRGRRALRRRRSMRGAGAGVLALAAAGIAVSLPHDDPRPGLDLVAYEGRQLPGFTVAKVPEGFVLQGATAYSLDVARANDTSSLDVFVGKLVVSLEETETVDDRATPASPVEPREGDHLVKDGHRLWLVHQDGTRELVREGEPTAPPEVSGPIDVDGDHAALHSTPDGARILEYEHGDITVSVQMWPGLGLTDAELREFADGITVTSEARVSVG